MAQVFQNKRLFCNSWIFVLILHVSLSQANEGSTNENSAATEVTTEKTQSTNPNITESTTESTTITTNAIKTKPTEPITTTPTPSGLNVTTASSSASYYYTSCIAVCVTLLASLTYFVQ